MASSDPADHVPIGSWLDQFDFTGKRAIVTGGSSGMGAAAAGILEELGAEVHVLDVAPTDASGVLYHWADLRDRASIDMALAECGDAIDVLINCAGMPQTRPALDVIACNIAGLRHLTEAVVAGMGSRPGAVVSVSSAAAFKWQSQKELIDEFLECPTMESSLEWADGRMSIGDPYVFSKMALNLYTVRRAPQLAGRGIRMNAVCPGNTITGMTGDFVQAAGQSLLDLFSSVIGRPATPRDQADVLVFLASPLARYVTGILLYVDGGFLAAQMTHQLPRPAPSVPVEPQ
jgi:NAD(P)-dependent dehydrogenase (short-subunit alcohol dehydrogenase family)